MKDTKAWRKKLITTIDDLKQKHLASLEPAVKRTYQCGDIDAELKTVADIQNFNFFGDISKIPMDPVLLLAKGLRDDYDSICLPGRHYCNISDSVTGLLQWQRISGSEDGLHSRDDYFIKIVKVLACAKVIRNSTAKSGSVSGKRPDCCILKNDVAVVRLEEKDEESKMEKAISELGDKMAGWLEIYGNIPFIVAIAIAGDELNVYKITKSMEK